MCDAARAKPFALPLVDVFHNNGVPRIDGALADMSVRERVAAAKRIEKVLQILRALDQRPKKLPLACAVLKHAFTTSELERVPPRLALELVNAVAKAPVALKLVRVTRENGVAHIILKCTIELSGPVDCTIIAIHDISWWRLCAVVGVEARVYADDRELELKTRAHVDTWNENMNAPSADRERLLLVDFGAGLLGNVGEMLLRAGGV